MDHPSVEIQLPFGDDAHRLAVPLETTHFYWGAVGVGTATDPPAALADEFCGAQTRILDECRDRIDCTLTLDGDAEALLEEVRRTGDRRERAFWKATEPPELPLTATATLTTDGEAPSLGSEPIALWTPANEVIPWGETVRTELELVAASSTIPMGTDRLWGRHDVYVPQPVSLV
ncbi:hypothetical protein G9464_10605 [Halostella sp. JP-L12]|uniref:hypothetical protein n=1 Tax=Halostella TaxID=1843185 RepID=UPI000EF7B169|nr:MULTISPECIES: hypothetical protein [Halostella]NHN48046.1 hypothetical protein [Halostella sp. JP-L12]